MARLLGEPGGRGGPDAPVFLLALRTASRRLGECRGLVPGWGNVGLGGGDFTSLSHPVLSVFCFPRIEEELGSKAKFAGRSFRNPLAK